MPIFNPSTTAAMTDEERKRQEEAAKLDQSGQTYTSTEVGTRPYDPSLDTTTTDRTTGTNVREHNEDGSTTSYRSGSYSDPNLAPLPKDLGVPGYDDRMNVLTNLMTTAGTRTAPTAAGATLAPLARAATPTAVAATTAAAPRLASAPSIGAAATPGGVSIRGAAATAAELADAERAAAASLDPIERANAARLAAAARARDSEFRGGQKETADFLGRLMRGEDSIAGLQAQRARQKMLAGNLAMARSARPGQGATAMRGALQSNARMGAEMAGRELEARMAERRSAADALAGLLGTARGQDIGLETFNVGEENKSATTQAGFEQQANLLNPQEANRRAATAAGFQQQTNLQNASEANRQAQMRAQLGTQANIATAQNQTQASVAQGQANAQVSIAGAQEANRMKALEAELGTRVDLANSDLDAKLGMFNADLSSRTGMFNADLASRTDLFNTGNENTRTLEQARLLQQNNQFNTGTSLQQQGMNDALTMGLLGQQGQTMAMQQQGAISLAQLQQARDLAKAGMLNQVTLTQMGIDASKVAEMDPTLAAILGAGKAVLPLAL